MGSQRRNYKLPGDSLLDHSVLIISVQGGRYGEVLLVGVLIAGDLLLHFRNFTHEVYALGTDRRGLLLCAALLSFVPTTPSCF